MLRHAFASPKLAALARKLGVRRYQAVGILEHLWYFTATQAPRGDIGRWTDEEIAAGIDWPADASVLVEALVSARWLDRCEEHRLLVHDWAEHCDQTVKRSPQVRKSGFCKLLTSDSLASDASAAGAAQDSLSQSLSPEPEPEPESLSGTAEAAPPPSERRPSKRAVPRTAAPDRLPEESIQALEQWTRENLPSELPQVRAHIDACLDHFRAKGQPMVDWEATCRNWIRRSPEMRRPGMRAPVAPPARKQTEQELKETARRLRAVEFDRRSHGEI